MTDPTFQEAYRRVRSRYGDQQWHTLSNRQISEDIYREIAVIDAEKREKPGDETPKPDQE